MDLIESMDPVAFTEYLKKYSNTICGRHPIGVLLNVSIDASSRDNTEKKIVNIDNHLFYSIDMIIHMSLVNFQVCEAFVCTFKFKEKTSVDKLWH
jgi:hypothetical protein